MNVGTIARNSTLLFLVGFANAHLEGEERIKTHMSQHVFYRTVKVDGLSIFYREAGLKDAPTILPAAWNFNFITNVRTALLADEHRRRSSDIKKRGSASSPHANH
jgi:hypothetical protein